MTATRPFTVDTNLLIYAIDRRDPIKHRIAERIIDTLLDAAGILPLQCLSEFYRSTTGKKLIEPATAELTVRRTMDFTTVVPSAPEDVLFAISLHRQHKLQFFDALLLATASRVGCTTLFSEDFQHGRTYGSVTARDPFKLSTLELDTLLA